MCLNEKCSSVWVGKICLTGSLLLYAFIWVIPRRLNNTEENTRHSEHGESLKSRMIPIKKGLKKLDLL